MKRAMACVAVLACTFAIGRLTTSSESKHTERVVERAVTSTPSTTTIVQRGGLSADDVRAVVREELAQVAPAPAPPVVDDAALGRARGALDSGMVDGVWTDDDRARLHSELMQLTPEQADEIFGRLIPALNSGQLRVDVTGPAV